MHDADVLIVGGGSAGLCCARRLCEAGVSCRLLEASDVVGGRIRTDHMEGFLLDRGFEVLLTAYPERSTPWTTRLWSCRVRAWGVDSLGRQVSAPRGPLAASPVLGAHRTFVRRHVGGQAADRQLTAVPGRLSLEELYEQPEQTTAARLQEEGFSPELANASSGPLFGGSFSTRIWRPPAVCSRSCSACLPRGTRLPRSRHGGHPTATGPATAPGDSQHQLRSGSSGEIRSAID